MVGDRELTSLSARAWRRTTACRNGLKTWVDRLPPMAGWSRREEHRVRIIVSFRPACKKWSPGVGLGGWPADVEGFSTAVTGARRMPGEGERQRFWGVSSNGY